MSSAMQPRLRRLETFPVNQGGETVFALRDPDGFSGSIVLPHGAAILASLMDGTRTVDEIHAQAQRHLGSAAGRGGVEHLVSQLDEHNLLDTPRFRERWKAEIERYLNNPVRPAAHAGGAYAADPLELREQLAALFTHV